MRRVSVVGGSCTGKTTFSRALAGILDVPFVELDALNWEANWTMADVRTFQERIRAATAGDAWVVDGNYGGRGARDIVWPRADTVVWLDLPLLVTLARMWRRTTDRIRRRETLWGGNQETIRNTFFQRQSLFVWAVTTHRRRRRSFAELMARPEYAHITFHRLRSAAEAERWLREERAGPDARPIRDRAPPAAR
jgi:adenylate kinase family enzyme